LAIRAVFGHFFGEGKSGRFTGVSGGGFRETGADSGLDWGLGSSHANAKKQAALDALKNYKLIS
jgi:hypothetical protein